MSTPIETNTEGLQEILRTVYNLPMAGGGSAEPDLVIGFDDTNFEGVSRPDQFTFDSAAVVSTYNKLLAGQTVNCVLNAKYWPYTGGCINASSPQVTALAKSEANNSARVGYINVYFQLWRNVSGHNGYWTFAIEFSVIGDDSAEISNAGCFAATDFTSVPYVGANG